MKLKNGIDWFIPERLKENLEVLSRARITVLVMFVISIFLFFNFIRPLLINRVDLAIYTAVAAILMGISPLIMKALKSQLIAANCFISISIILLTFVTIERGGVSSYYAINFASVVVIAFLITNLLNGIIWGVICTFILAGMKFAEIAGVKFASVSAESAHINIVVFILTITILSSIYEWNSTTNLKQFAREKNQSEKSNQTIRKILDDASRVMSGVAQGDLSQRIKLDIQGEMVLLKESINSALDMLGNSVIKVLLTSQEINNGTSELSSASQELANGTSEQAASLEEISASMGEILSKAVQIHQNAADALMLSNKAVVDVEKGNEQMESMQVAMTKINDTSTNVAKVIKVIDEIAFQTNLLALNASVEAARAGKYGKGFAVVAEEVRNLAARSAEAAKNTTELIETSIQNVKTGVQYADDTAATLHNFVNSITQINNIVSDISSASKEQTAGVNEITLVMDQVNNVVQKNSSISEETASFSEELSAQADILQKLMNRFRLKRNKNYLSEQEQETLQLSQS